MFFDKEADIYAPPGNPRIGNDKEDSFITFLIVVVIVLAFLTILNLTPKEKISTKLAYHVGDFVEEDVSAINIPDQYFLTPTPPVTRRTTPRV